METKEKSKIRSLLTIKQFSAKHPAFSPMALRHLIFDASKNGSSRVIIRMGNKKVFVDAAFFEMNKIVIRVGKKKVLIDEEAFFEWMDIFRDPSNYINQSKK